MQPPSACMPGVAMHHYMTMHWYNYAGYSAFTASNDAAKVTQPMLQLLLPLTLLLAPVHWPGARGQQACCPGAAEEGVQAEADGGHRRQRHLQQEPRHLLCEWTAALKECSIPPAGSASMR